MELTGQSTNRLALVLLYVVGTLGVFVEPPLPVTQQRSLAESQTRLPCRYEVQEEEKVVQVTWFKQLPGGTKDQIIIAHFMDGQTEFGRYAGRVRFESEEPTQNSALLIPSTEESDEGRYTCHISAFPYGSFERHITLAVWILPISSLDPEVLMEGQSFRLAASCRAMGRPTPRVSWDTDLPGQIQNRSKTAGSVSSFFSLHPLRSMNGKKLDCLVWHPALQQPRRISNQLVVQYPPDATISTDTAKWFIGLENAELMCSTGGQPRPQNITWTWGGGALPDGTAVVGERLVFRRPLRLNDSGVFECTAKNSVGTGKSEYLMSVGETSRFTGGSTLDKNLLVIICSSAGALVLLLVIIVLLVNRHHRQKNAKLVRALGEKTQEIDTLSRQASFRRLNSLSSDPRGQPEDYALLRVDSRMKNSQGSLEPPTYIDGHSILDGKWGPVDELGRPVIWNDGHTSLRGAETDGEKEERRRRVESYLKNSNMSLDSGLPSSLVPVKAQQEEGGVGPRVSDPQPHREGDSPQSVAQGREDDEDSGSCQISEALTNHFYYSNGVLRPKPHSNAILLAPRPQIV